MQVEGTLISTFFIGFPDDEKVDAVYERDRHGQLMAPIIIIRKNNYYMFSDTQLYSGYTLV